jgi:hypothetical protein
MKPCATARICQSAVPRIIVSSEPGRSISFLLDSIVCFFRALNESVVSNAYVNPQQCPLSVASTFEGTRWRRPSWRVKGFLSSPALQSSAPCRSWRKHGTGRGVCMVLESCVSNKAVHGWLENNGQLSCCSSSIISLYFFHASYGRLPWLPVPEGLVRRGQIWQW